MSIEVNTKKDFFSGGVSGIFTRICEIYRLGSDAELGRKLGMTGQAVYNHRRRDSIPFEAILANCLASDWPQIFLGDPAKLAPPPTIEQALRVITDAGYSVRKGE